MAQFWIGFDIFLIGIALVGITAVGVRYRREIRAARPSCAPARSFGSSESLRRQKTWFSDLA